MIVVAWISVYAYLFFAFFDLTCHSPLWPEGSYELGSVQPAVTFRVQE